MWPLDAITHAIPNEGLSLYLTHTAKTGSFGRDAYVSLTFQMPKTTHGMATQDLLYPSIFLQWEGHHLHRQIFGVVCKLAQGVDTAVLISTFLTGVLTTAMPLQQSPTMPVCNAPDFIDLHICSVALGRRACKSTRVQQGLQKLTWPDAKQDCSHARARLHFRSLLCLMMHVLP